MAEVLETEQDEVVAGQLADPDLVESRQQLLRGCELATGQGGDVDIAPCPVIEPLMDVQKACNRCALRQARARQPLAFRAQANDLHEHGVSRVQIAVTEWSTPSRAFGASERRLAAADRTLGRSRSSGSIYPA